MKRLYPEFEGNELFANTKVEKTNPDGFLEDDDSIWVEVTNEDLLDIALENNLISEEQTEVEYLDNIMADLEPLYESWMIDKFIDKLRRNYEDDIKECGGLEVVFENGKRIVIK